MSDKILEVKGLSISYGGIRAVRELDFHVNRGEIVSLIGANGAGKSSTLRAISGLVKAESGSVKFESEEIVGKSPDLIVGKGITMVPEGRKIFPDLTVYENLKLGAYLRKDNIKEDLARCFELFPILEEREWQEGGTLSGGEQQMLAVARALMSRPKLLMMDEPSLGLAPMIVRDIFDIIKRINDGGVTILLIEQNANMALKIADRAYVLESGEVTMEGTGEELLKDEKVISAYLGA
jgi:branched-chain amino acid transport system ATP-binding protein